MAVFHEIESSPNWRSRFTLGLHIEDRLFDTFIDRNLLDLSSLLKYPLNIPSPISAQCATESYKNEAAPISSLLIPKTKHTTLNPVSRAY